MGSSESTTDAAALLKITPRISKKLENENDYPAWSAEATRQIWRMKLSSVVTRDQQTQPTTNSEE